MREQEETYHDEDNEYLSAVFAPFDRRAWQRFAEWDPEAARHLEAGIAAGAITPDDVKAYGRSRCYSEQTVGWLVQAAKHLIAQRKATAEEWPPVAHANEGYPEAATSLDPIIARHMPRLEDSAVERDPVIAPPPRSHTISVTGQAAVDPAAMKSLRKKGL